MINNPATKYAPATIVKNPNRRWPDNRLTQPPRWLSTDLRDGNQALATPMDQERKLHFFEHLVRCGFKEIEVAFPSASQTDFDFVRHLIESNKIPNDVWIQVITQSRVDLIETTMASLAGAPRAIVHLYNATAPVFRELVFKKSKAQTIELAVAGVTKIKELAEQQPDTQWCLQYSPETFCFTELDFALEICEAVKEVWQPSEQRPLILNLPTTVEVNTPNVFADQIELFINQFSDLSHITISVHPHNDRGTGVASAELALLAGAQRVEGCLFGNGERTGNVDLVTLALNLYSQGVAPQLDFSDIKKSVEVTEYCNRLPVHPRHPYAGELVFTAFSGSHQDAIKKGFAQREQDASGYWQIPYLPLDPKDVGCNYEEVIRVNSQSGKSGAAWLLEQNHGLQLPRTLQVDFSQQVKSYTDRTGIEMTLAEIWQLFRESYGVVSTPRLALINYTSQPLTTGQQIEANVLFGGQQIQLNGSGNGLLSALINAVRTHFNININIKNYSEHTLGHKTQSKAVTYVECEAPDHTQYFGVAIDADTSRASIQAILNAVANYLIHDSRFDTEQLRFVSA
ncbi:2-isopropylmalate synthase [Pseudoalteromonas luteoviolacea]|uniref:2-isopropylmalate synthase n=1 Tax=Pseudoalteromonas luteoviolacea TaxID=43657 RepID=UPI001EED0765|nr:2-isopropylmalate synthase [Pseudoalteromonas luteoviolacea]